MIDMIFAVDDTLEFHAANVAANPDHYSFLRHLGIDTIQYVCISTRSRPARALTRASARTHARADGSRSPPRTFTSTRWCLCRGSG